MSRLVKDWSDFSLYTRTVVRYLRSNPDKFPCISEVVCLLDDVTSDEFAVGLGTVILWHFYRNHPVYITAEDIERCSREAKQLSLMIMATDGATIH